MVNSMDYIFNSLLEITIFSSIMIIATMAMKAIFKDKIKQNIVNLLWLLVLIRLILPTTMVSPVHFDMLLPESSSIQNVEHQINQSDNNNMYENTVSNNNYDISYPEMKHDIKAEQLSQTTQTSVSFIDKLISLSKGINYKVYMLIVWTIGIAYILTKSLMINRRFMLQVKRDLKRKEDYLDDIVFELKNELGIKKKIQITQSNSIDIPLVCGFAKPIIVIPTRLYARINSDKLRLIIRHELSHIKRHDVFKNYLWLLAKTVYWFNPIVWIGYNSYLDDIEIACDDMVAKSITREDSFLYSQSLIDVIKLSKENKRIPIYLSFCKDKKTLRKRVENMIKPTKKLRTVSFTALLLAILMIVGCFTTACQPTPEKKVVSSKTTDIEDVIKNNDEGEVTTTLVKTTDYYETPERYANELEGVNVKVFVDAKINGPEDNAIRSIIFEDAQLTQEMADEFLDYFIGNKSLYEKVDGSIRTKTQLQNDILMWERHIFEAQNSWEDVRLHDPYFEYETSETAIKEFEKYIEEIKEAIKTAPDENDYREISRELIPENGSLEIEGYSPNEDKISDDSGRIHISSFVFQPSSYTVTIMSYENTNEYIEKDTTIEEMEEQTGLTLDSAVNQIKEITKHFGIDEIVLSNYSINHRKRNNKVTPSYFMEFDMAINNIPIPKLRDGTRLNTNIHLVNEAPPLTTICAEVDETGVIRFSIHNVKKELSLINSDVKIMSFDETLEIFETKLLHTLYVPEGNTKEVYITDISLSLMLLSKKNSKEMVSVPVWDFKGYSFDPNNEKEKVNVLRNKNNSSSFLTLNAVDGSIIDRITGH